MNDETTPWALPLAVHYLCALVGYVIVNPAVNYVLNGSHGGLSETVGRITLISSFLVAACFTVLYVAYIAIQRKLSSRLMIAVAVVSGLLSTLPGYLLMIAA